MKVLFLDIDGVVNSQDSTNFKNNLWPIDPYMAFLVGKVQLDTNCVVVLSSSWRHHPQGVATVKKGIVDVYDVTPSVGNKRGDEINAWLNAHQEVTKYAILDDDSDFYEYQHLFKTTFKHGLTEQIAQDVTAWLNS